GLAKLEAVTKNGEIPSAFAQLIDVLLGFLAETFQEQAREIIRRQDLRPVGVDPSVADANFVHAVQQFRNEIETEARAAERGDLSLGCDDDARVLDRVVEVFLIHSIQAYDCVSGV